MKLLRLILINISLTSILLVVAGTKEVEASMENTIRVGLESRYTNASTVELANNSVFFGEVGAEGMNIRGFLQSNNGIRVIVDNAYYLDMAHAFGGFEEALAAAMLYESALVHMNEWGFGIYIGPFYSIEEAQRNQTVYGGTITSPHPFQIRLTNGVRNIMVADTHLLFIDGNNELLNLGGRRYRGMMELGRQIGDGITPVNIVDVEEYLYSVVPSEMPALWHIEALKAQAVTARSFTFTSRGSHNHLGYELVDTIFSQVYAGVEAEHENSTRAVRETNGIMAFHNNVPILGTYFSSSGGFTESSEYVWIEAVPYLRAVADTFEQGAMEWTRSFALSEINNLANNQNINVGQIQSVSIAGSTPGGRVASLVLQGTNGSHVLEGENIRTFFSGSAEGSLESRTFEIVDGVVGNYKPVSLETFIASNTEVAVERFATGSFVLSSGGELSELLENANFSVLNIFGLFNSSGSSEEVTQSSGEWVTFSGRGWGHGVGMSQFGANAMANQGFNFAQILEHYFTGIVVR